MGRQRRKQLNKLPSFFVRGTYFDYPTLFLILFLVAFGLIMVFSASYFTSIIDTTDSRANYFFRKQLIYALVGIAAMIFIANYSYQRIFRFSKLLMCMEVVLLLSVWLFPDVNGSHRWIMLGPIQFQPSELAKLVLIVYMAHICTAYEQDLYNFWKTTWHLIFPVFMIGIIAMENLSTAIICAVIVFGVYFISTPRPQFIGIYILAGALAVAGFILLKSYRGNRLDAWLHPEESDYGYQTMQSLYAIGSGGLFGRGLGNSIQKLGAIPESHNDMIFSVVCEELGIVGAIGLLVVFLLLLWRLRFLAEGAADRLGSLMVVGIIAHISIQVIINICVVTNIFPNTGVPLPFVSYGGTSIMILLAEMGVALSVSRQIIPKGKERGVRG